MAEPTDVCGSAELGSCRLAVVRCQLCGHVGFRAFQTAGTELRDNCPKSFATPRDLRVAAPASPPGTQRSGHDLGKEVLCVYRFRAGTARSRDYH